jgi:crotonobetainyl-CoA:carnitine CoA-transferase CaiB-like acyl-CoA transferase
MSADRLSTTGPLQGLRVIDAGNMIAGPLAATLLGDFGADVIKIEQPGLGDPMRHWTPAKDDRSLWWKVLGRNKRLITLNLSTSAGQELLRRLVPTVDVVIENYRPGTFARWGLGYEALSALNPGLVLVHVSGYGQTGPYRHRGGYGTIAEAFSGVPSFTGFPDRPPTLPGFPMADSVAATFAAMATMCAVYERDHSEPRRGHTPRRGQEIDVSLYEPLFRLVGAQVIGFDQLGLVKQRRGNRMEEDSPRNTYRTRDGRWIAISASSQKTFERLAHAMERDDLAIDPRFTDNVRRVANAEVLDQLIADWFAQRDADAVIQLFDRENVVAGLVYDIRDIFKDPHYAARENIVEVPDDDFGHVRMQGVVPRFLRTPGSVRRAGGRIGQDNDAIYRSELGLGDADLEQLRAQKVI